MMSLRPAACAVLSPVMRWFARRGVVRAGSSAATIVVRSASKPPASAVCGSGTASDATIWRLMMTVATSVICCFSSFALAVGSGMCTIGGAGATGGSGAITTGGTTTTGGCTGLASTGGAWTGVGVGVGVVTTGGRCLTIGFMPTAFSTRSVSIVAAFAEAWAAVMKPTVASRLIESSRLASCAAVIPAWFTVGSRRARIVAAAAVPHTVLGAFSTSIVSSGTAASSGRAAVDRAASTAGPTAAFHAAAAGSSRPRTRVTRRYSTDAIDGGRGDWRSRPVTV